MGELVSGLAVTPGLRSGAIERWSLLLAVLETMEDWSMLPMGRDIMESGWLLLVVQEVAVE